MGSFLPICILPCAQTPASRHSRPQGAAQVVEEGHRGGGEIEEAAGVQKQEGRLMGVGQGDQGEVHGLRGEEGVGGRPAAAEAEAGEESAGAEPDQAKPDAEEKPVQTQAAAEAEPERMQAPPPQMTTECESDDFDSVEEAF